MIRRTVLLSLTVLLFLCIQSCEKEKIVHHDFVDLGLSVKWASCNIGAENPWDYGDYYAWGEVETKSSYLWSSYKYCTGETWTLTKYNVSINFGRIVDKKMSLDIGDDVAHVEWGGNWRMPTQDELNELLDTVNCIWKWTKQNGVKGYQVISKKSGYEGMSIFLPAAGCSYSDFKWSADSIGYYWSSSLTPGDSDEAWSFILSSTDTIVKYRARFYGQSVRPVCP